jgi:arylsulfatase A-like enzyme
VAPPPLGYKPHLIFFLGDDVGHFNMGWRNNSEARTPHMDALVSEGIVLDRHYVYQVRDLSLPRETRACEN